MKCPPCQQENPSQAKLAAARLARGLYPKHVPERGIDSEAGLEGERGLFIAKGDPWLRQPRLMQPTSHCERVAAYAETVVALDGR